MKRKYEREFTEAEVFRVVEKTKIGIIGIGRGSGASFIATSVAMAAAACQERPVAFAEIDDYIGGRTWIYDSAGMDRRFVGKKYASLHEKVVHGRYIRGCINPDRGVNWAVTTPSDRKTNLSRIQKARLINNISGDIIICDLGVCTDEELLEDMDIIICVIDPKPSRLIGSREIYRKMKEYELSGRKVIWVINKVNGGISRKSFRDYLKVKTTYEIPLIKDVHFYAAEYNCRFPMEQNEIKKTISKIIEDMSIT